MQVKVQKAQWLLNSQSLVSSEATGKEKQQKWVSRTNLLHSTFLDF